MPDNERSRADRPRGDGPRADGPRVAIVTGAAGTLGAAMCARFVRDGIAVVVADMALEPAQELAARLVADGGTALPLAVDVTDYQSVESLVAATLDWAGRLDILVNNAGVSEGHVPTWEMPLTAWQRTIDVDLTGVFHGCRAVLPTMLEAAGAGSSTSRRSPARKASTTPRRTRQQRPG